MESKQLTPPVWVETPQRLQGMLDDLSRVKSMAVDTESNSLYAYHEQVCLLQISTESTDYLVDPFALSDLSGLAPVFADPAVEKVFHAAEYDIICLKRDFGLSFANLFDTMLAGRILGKEKLGLGNMLEEQFGIKLDKRYQRANWGKRPLPPELLAYARLDSHYLIPLRNRLYQELDSHNLLGLAREDFIRLCAVEGAPEANGDEHCWRVAGSQDLSPRQMVVLDELCKYREHRAEAANVPPFKVLGNKELLAIALACPRTVEQLEKMRVLSNRQFNRFGEGLVTAVLRGIRARLLQRPARKPRSDNLISRVDNLRNWRKKKGLTQRVESDVILPRDILENIAVTNPQKLEELRVVMEDVPYRFEHYGEDILEALRY